MAQILGRTPDHLDGLWCYPIVSDVRRFRCEHSNAAGRKGTSEIDQSWLVDSQVMHTYHHYDAGRATDSLRQIEPAANAVVQCSNRDVRFSDRTGAVVGQSIFVLRIRDTQQQSSCAEMALHRSRDEGDR